MAPSVGGLGRSWVLQLRSSRTKKKKIISSHLSPTGPPLSHLGLPHLPFFTFHDCSKSYCHPFVLTIHGHRVCLIPSVTSNWPRWIKSRAFCRWQLLTQKAQDLVRVSGSQCYAPVAIFLKEFLLKIIITLSLDFLVVHHPISSKTSLNMTSLLIFLWFYFWV